MHFFTNIDLLQPQTQPQAFGAKGSSNGNDIYQVTSKHSAASDATAYAVCGGTVFIQQNNANANLVNLILKPFSQPDFAFPKVKFFIYRGIKKDSLINGSEIADRAINDLTKSIWESQDAINATLQTTNNPPAQALGTDIVAPNYSDATFIENVFYRTDADFQLPQVKEGWSIGTFNATEFGFEIMIESVGFEPALLKVRNSNNVVEVPTLSSNPTQPQEFEHWHDKEEILNYIDPCAFWGGHFLYRLRVKSSNGNSENKRGNDLYDDVLVKFYNKNKLYVDIRNEYSFSFNYFKNYGTDIQLAFDNSLPLSATNYYSSGWCLLEIENNSFPTNNTNSNENILRIAMPDGDGDNPLPLMYISAGYLSSHYPREPKDKNKMIDLTVDNGLTNEIKLSVPNRKGLSNTTVVCSYIKLKYCKQLDPEAQTPPVSSGTVIRAASYLDNIFAPLDMKFFWSGDENIKSAIYDDEMYVDAKAIVNTDFIGSVGIAKDVFNYNFIFVPAILRQHRNNRRITEPLSISSETDNTKSDFFANIANQFNSNLRKSQFEFPPNTIDYVEFVRSNDTFGISEFQLPDIANSIAGFIIDQNTDWDNLLTLANSNFIAKYRIYIGVTNIVATIDEFGFNCKSYDLVLRGYALISGTIQVKEVLTTIKLYSNGTI